MYKIFKYKLNLGKTRRIITFIFLISFTFQFSFAQNDITNFESIDYANLKIPPLQELFENAKKSPAVKFYKTKADAEQNNMKSEKLNWLKYLRIGGAWQYGKVNINSAFSNEDTPLFYQYSGALQNIYYVSANVMIPLDELFNRKNKISRQKAIILASEYERDKWHDEQKLRIIASYTKIMKELAMMKVKVEAMTFANSQYKISEHDFLNGKIDAVQLSEMKSRQMAAIEIYETTKEELNRSLLELEILSKTQIISK